MARTISDIQQEIIDAKNTDTTLSSYTWSTSNVAIWRLWTYIIAVSIWTLEQLFDYHKAEMKTLLSNMKPHTLQWYVYKAKLFQLGAPLPIDNDNYPTPSSDPSVIIIKHAAAVELSNLVRIKVAKETSGLLSALNPVELDAFSNYMKRIKDAGVRLQVTSGNADILQLALTIYYDPLILTASGARIDGAATSPVFTAISQFIAALPFNGVFVLSHLAASLQQIEGVRIGLVNVAQASYGTLSYAPISVTYTPDAGYMQLDTAYFNTNILYIPYTAL